MGNYSYIKKPHWQKKKKRKRKDRKTKKSDNICCRKIGIIFLIYKIHENKKKEKLQLNKKIIRNELKFHSIELQMVLKWIQSCWSYLNIKLLTLILKRNANENLYRLLISIYGMGKNLKLTAYTVAVAVGKQLLSHIPRRNDKWYNSIKNNLITAILQKNIPIIYE